MKNKSNIIPQYKGKGLFGWASELITNSFQFCIEEKDIGDTFLVSLPTTKLIVSSNAEFIHHVLVRNAKNYEKSQNYNYVKLFLGNGLFTSKGALWKKQRRIIQPVFTKKHLNHLFQIMVNTTDEFINQLKLKVEQNSIIEISEEMTVVTADIAMKTLFSSINPQDKKKMFASNAFFQDYVITRIFKPYLKYWLYLNGTQTKFHQQKRELRSTMKNLVLTRQEMEEQPDDLLGMLLDSKDPETGDSMPFDQILDEVATLYFAGHETSANSLIWILYLLSENQEELQKLKVELESINANQISLEVLNELFYCKNVIQEAMRMYPAAHAVSRVSKSEDVINGFHIPKNSLFQLSIAGLHRNSAYWKDPHQFIPERFSIVNGRSIPKKNYIPFGSGARMCIGNHFAMMEIQIVLIKILKQFDFKLCPSQKIETSPEITLRPKYGMKMELKNRLN